LVANVETVNIELSKTQLKFQFNEDNNSFVIYPNIASKLQRQ